MQHCGYPTRPNCAAIARPARERFVFAAIEAGPTPQLRCLPISSRRFEIAQFKRRKSQLQIGYHFGPRLPRGTGILLKHYAAAILRFIPGSWWECGTPPILDEAAALIARPRGAEVLVTRADQTLPGRPALGNSENGLMDVVFGVPWGNADRAICAPPDSRPLASQNIRPSRLACFRGHGTMVGTGNVPKDNW